MRVLIFIRHYIPGFKHGGPIRSVANLVAQLGSDMGFDILTSDRDALDPSGYPDVPTNKWINTDHARVMYMDQSDITKNRLIGLMSAEKYDVVYLNSFFDFRFSVLPVWLTRFGICRRAPIILAPRGEFSQGALRLKKWKKETYIAFANRTKAYDRVFWQATSDEEANDIAVAIGSGGKRMGGERILTVPNVVMSPDLEATANQSSPRVAGEPLRVCFLSRISRKKNLDFALRVLAAVAVPVDFRIYGTCEDSRYWGECEELIVEMPSNIKVTYCGPVPHDEIIPTLSNHDVFFLPTLGENFGHVIFEAMSAGLPVLLSDQTPWTDVHSRGAGWTFPLSDIRPFIDTIRSIDTWSHQRFHHARNSARKVAAEYGRQNDMRQKSLELFVSAAASG